MVVDIERESETDLVLHALSDSTRRDIVRRTMVNEHSVSDLARFYPMSFAAVQKHVAVLQRAQLVAKRQQGREQLVRARIDAIRKAAQLLDELETLWRGRIDRMTDLLAIDEAATEAAPDTPPTKPRTNKPNPRSGATT